MIHGYGERFKTFCFKYELEALILAAEAALALRLETSHIPVTWRIPVEDQNNIHPPKHIVEALFHEHQQRYIETVDAPLILGLADYHAIETACPQCFQPLVAYLEALT
jgi:hypothetical protein